MVRALRFALPILSLLLLAAHFFRADLYPLVAACVALGGLLLVERSWAARALQVALLCGAAEWLRTAWLIASQRAAHAQPYARLLVILGAIAIVTVAAAALVSNGRSVPSHDGSN